MGEEHDDDKDAKEERVEARNVNFNPPSPLKQMPWLYIWEITRPLLLLLLLLLLLMLMLMLRANFEKGRSTNEQ